MPELIPARPRQSRIRPRDRAAAAARPRRVRLRHRPDRGRGRRRSPGCSARRRCASCASPAGWRRSPAAAGSSTAELGATVVQTCVVTLDPVTTRIDQPVRRAWLPEAAPRARRARGRPGRGRRGRAARRPHRPRPGRDRGAGAGAARLSAQARRELAAGAAVAAATDDEAEVKPFAALAALRGKMGDGIVRVRANGPCAAARNRYVPRLVFPSGPAAMGVTTRAASATSPGRRKDDPGSGPAEIEVERWLFRRARSRAPSAACAGRMTRWSRRIPTSARTAASCAARTTSAAPAATTTAARSWRRSRGRPRRRSRLTPARARLTRNDRRDVPDRLRPAPRGGTGDIVISIDAMGGDRGVAEVMRGMAKSLEKNPRLRYILHGDAELLTRSICARRPAARRAAPRSATPTASSRWTTSRPGRCAAPRAPACGARSRR